jgi:hypothetical protein
MQLTAIWYTLRWLKGIYDTGGVDPLVALHLLKRALYLQDVNGEKCALYYVKDKEKREAIF